MIPDEVFFDNIENVELTLDKIELEIKKNIQEDIERNRRKIEELTELLDIWNNEEDYNSLPPSEYDFTEDLEDLEIEKKSGNDSTLRLVRDYFNQKEK